MSKPPKPKDDERDLEEEADESLIPRPLRGVGADDPTVSMPGALDATEESVPGLFAAEGGLLKGVVLGPVEDFTTEDSGTFQTKVDDGSHRGEYETVYDVRVHLNADELDVLGEPSYVGAALERTEFEPIVIGRDRDCNLVVNGSLVSGKHARLIRTPEGLELEDLDSANGTFVADQPIKRVRIGWDQAFVVGDKRLVPRDVVRMLIGRSDDAHTSVISPDMEDDEPSGWGVVAMAEKSVLKVDKRDGLIVGRGAESDVVLDTPNVSRVHARLERAGDCLRVTDLGSTNGTFVNGHRITSPTLVYPKDDLRIGPHRLEITSDLGVAHDATRESGIAGVRIDAWKLTRQVGPPGARVTIVDEVSFSVLPGEMVAVMGPSGAGKTSVLTTLAGYTIPSSGEVDIDGLNLYTHYDVFRSAIGYVPQEDVMHRRLTVYEVLFYQARMIFPAEFTREELDERILRVLGRLDLAHVRDTIVGDEVKRGLSGGQRKRLNVAMELLAEPSLLLLDEPTSGLDSRTAISLIRQFRGLAQAGRTVVMTVHQPRLESFELFDKLLLLTKGGKVAYFGPVDGARTYFDVRSDVPDDAAANPADYVLEALDPADVSLAKTPDYWQNSYRVSRQYERFVGRRLKAGALRQVLEPGPGTKRRKASFVRQTRILITRAFRLLFRDRSAVTVQLLQAPIIAGLAVLLFQKGRFWPMRLEDDITPTLFVIVAASVWFGCSNVAREIVGERSIYRRERMRKLRPGAYLLSKLVVNGLVIMAQMLILIGLLMPLVGLQGNMWWLLGVPILTGWSAMGIGLLVSAAAKSDVTAIQIVPLVVLPQVMLSGILVPVGGSGAAPMANLLSQPVLLRWAFSAYLHVEFSEGTPRGDKSRNLVTGGRYWEQVGFGGDELIHSLTMIGGIGFICVFLTWIILLYRDRR